MNKRISVKLSGHEYRYEAYQILSLFYNKDDIFFCESDCGVYDIECSLDGNRVKCIAFMQETAIEESIDLICVEKKAVKNAVKTVLLKVLQRLTGIEIPWGILVGIRPTKIVHELVKENYNISEIKDIMRRTYSVNDQKINLVTEVAENESAFLKKPEKAVSLYIGIPFCPTRCIYCSFASNSIDSNRELVEQYKLSLYNEIDSTMQELLQRNIKADTLYIGGGTPTSLDSASLDKLLENTGRYIDFAKLREFTVEAGRPDSIDSEKLNILKSYGVKRISINPQTMNEETLKTIGRGHSVSDIIEKFNMAREIGFDNINMDIIVGLPGETSFHMQHTINEITALNPDSITIHTMSIKRASRLNEQKYKGKSDQIAEMYAIASDGARNIGMHPYYMYRQKNMISPLENIGYCKEGKECIYNIQMIAENISIIALGADAVSKIIFEDENRIERYANLKDVREYVERIDEIIAKKKEAISFL